MQKYKKSFLSRWGRGTLTTEALIQPVSDF